MTPVSESVIEARRRSRRQLLFQSDIGYNVLADSVIDEDKHNSQISKQSGWILFELCKAAVLLMAMHKSTRTGLIGIAILICVVIVVLLLNLQSFKPHKIECLKLEGDETCYSVDPQPYRYYGTKTSYHIALGNNSDYKLDNVGDCQPIVFYLLSRHATRYPDKDDIVDMNKILPSLKDKIINSSLSGTVKMCQDDLQKLKDWTKNLEPSYDNKLSATGEKEAMEFAQRLKEKFPAILNQRYSQEHFIFEYTSRERTRSTAESFAKGLFGEESKKVNFEEKTNDEVLQFHKECKIKQKRCKDFSIDTSEIENFEKGSLMKQAVESISKRVGFPLSHEEVKVMYKACVFGYALESGDIWCAIFSNDELKVLEFGDDIDDYYKDAYGNSINYEQACPVAKYLVNLFKSYENTTNSKVVLHFSHAGGVKKVFPLFGLFKDEKPLTADDFCSQQDRKWRSSLISPFNTNIEFILYQCENNHKVVAFHNEKPVQIGGCKDILCTLDEFYEMYSPIAKTCDIDKICCKCCVY